MNSEYAAERAGLTTANLGLGPVSGKSANSLAEQINTLCLRIGEVALHSSDVKGRLFGFEDSPNAEKDYPSPPGIVNEIETAIANAHRKLSQISDALAEINRRL